MLLLASAVYLFFVFFCVLLVFLAAQGATLHLLLAVPALQMQWR
jgi:hypothetical protein